MPIKIFIRGKKMIHGVIHTTAFSSIGYNIRIYGNKKLSFPVSHSNYIYSQFEHVAGTPAPEGIHGVTITKLKTLDVLIDKLVEIKKEGTSHINLGGSLSDDRIDALIRQYEYQIRQAKAATVALSAMSVSEDSSGGVLDFMV
jgi:hypothetical protein